MHHQFLIAYTGSGNDLGTRLLIEPSNLYCAKSGGIVANQYSILNQLFIITFSTFVFSEMKLYEERACLFNFFYSKDWKC